MEMSYHEHCVQCCACGDRLHYTCFVRDAKLYCRIDYDRLYIKKCLGCSERVSPEELVMRATENIFHLRCFVCVVCGLKLQKGDLYVIKQGQLFCRTDYEKEVEMMQGYGSGEFTCDDVLQPNRSHDGRRGPKRPRTILTTQQRRAFKASFEVSPKPCRKIRENLAKDTGLSVRIVQVWFQNQRAKMKKMQKKARQDNKEAGKDLENEEKALHVKQEEQSPRSSSFLNDSCSDSETTTGEVDGILHSAKLEEGRYIKEEIDDNASYLKRGFNLQQFQGDELSCSTASYFRDHAYHLITMSKDDENTANTDVDDVNDDLETRENNSFGVVENEQDIDRMSMLADDSNEEKPGLVNPNEDHEFGIPHSFQSPALFLNPPAAHQNHPHGTLNPIDRLYSMQNSYFCSNDENMLEP
ncbi:hypothetical protein HHI36_019459 [Cryptolaemus montrouzieri]|uniref:Uncharacterized protein n=1 Tax=Cryptolaemus montrouzieri TaxID=559131 RepID=A0ABD2P365_9CUCU